MTTYMNASNQIFAVLVGFAYLLLLGEYAGLYFFPDQLMLWPESILNMLAKFNSILRPSAPVLCLLCALFIQPDPSKPLKTTKRISPVFLILAVCLLAIYYGLIGNIIYLSDSIWLFAYPINLCTSAISSFIIGKALSFRPNPWGIKNPKRKQRSRLGFHLRLKDGWINLTNPFRGILVIGAAGSGKSYSIAEPIIHQAAQKAYTGIIYDFKFPTLANVAYTAYHKCPEDITLYVLNFTDLSRSHRVNPLKPENMPVIAYAESYAQAMISNLIPESIKHKDFWIRSATAVLTATIWYLKKHHPAYCSLPHVVALICHPKFEGFVPKLAKDVECRGLIASLSTAIEKEADKQIAGVLGSLQIALARINNPHIAWVMSGDDFDLQLNDPTDKKLLVIGNHPTLSDTFAPVISCIMTVSLKLMNRPAQHHSMVLLDEGPTLYIPQFEQIPATARSNNIATIYMAQDISQMVQSYGQVNAEVILANLNSQIFGRVSNQRTAEYVSSIFGKEAREVINRNESVSRSVHQGIIPYQIPRKSKSVSYQQQEVPLVKPQEVMNLSVGEFTGVAVGKGNEWFKGKNRRRKASRIKKLPAFASGIDVQQDFKQIQQEVIGILGNRL